jgi:hypothetical protein
LENPGVPITSTGSSLEQDLLTLFHPETAKVPVGTKNVQLGWFEGELLYLVVDDATLDMYNEEYKPLLRNLQRYVAGHISDWQGKHTTTTLHLHLGATPGVTVEVSQSHYTSHKPPVDVVLRGDTIDAVVRSDNADIEEVEFNAVRWFERASAEEIQSLAGEGWNCCYEADRIAYDSQDLYPELAAILVSGFNVSVDEQQAVAWLSKHRPDIELEEE